MRNVPKKREINPAKGYFLDIIEMHTCHGHVWLIPVRVLAEVLKVLVLSAVLYLVPRIPTTKNELPLFYCIEH